MPERPDDTLTKWPATVRVIRWEGLEGFGWAVDIDHGNGKHRAYPVGAQQAAEAEAQRVRSGDTPWTREEVEQHLRNSGLT
jgi:hypothetical protein